MSLQEGVSRTHRNRVDRFTSCFRPNPVSAALQWPRAWQGELSVKAVGQYCWQKDPLYGSIASHLKLDRQFTFLDAFSHWGRMDQDLWNQLLINYSGMDILLGPETSESAISGLQWPETAEFLNFMRKRHSISFLDCPGLFTDWYTQLASAADGVFLITTNEATAIQAARRSLERLEQFGCETEKIRLVVNRYEPQNGVAIKAIEAALGRDVFHILPSDREAMHKCILRRSADWFRLTARPEHG